MDKDLITGGTIGGGGVILGLTLSEVNVVLGLLTALVALIGASLYLVMMYRRMRASGTEIEARNHEAGYWRKRYEKEKQKDDQEVS